MNIRTAVLKSEIFIEYLDVANDDVWLVYGSFIADCHD